MATRAGALLPGMISRKAAAITGGKIGTAAGMAGNTIGQSRLARGFMGATEGAADVAIFEGIEMISETMLGDSRDFVDHLLGEVGVGAAFGGLFGGMLGAGLSRGIIDEGVANIAEKSYGRALKKENKISPIAERLANGDSELADKIKKSLDGDDDGKLVSEIAGDNGTIDNIVDDVTSVIQDEVQTLLDLGVVARSASTGDNKRYTWARMFEEEGSKEALVNTDPRKVYDTALSKMDDMLVRLEGVKQVGLSTKNDRLTSEMAEEIRQWSNVRDNILQRYAEDVSSVPGARMIFDEEAGSYIISRESQEYTDFLHGLHGAYEFPGLPVGEIPFEKGMTPQKFMELSQKDKEKYLAKMVKKRRGVYHEGKTPAELKKVHEANAKIAAKDVARLRGDIDPFDDAIASASGLTPVGFSPGSMFEPTATEVSSYNSAAKALASLLGEKTPKLRDQRGPGHAQVERLNTLLSKAKEKRLALKRELDDAENRASRPFRGKESSKKSDLEAEARKLQKTETYKSVEESASGEIPRGNMRKSLPEVYAMLDKAKGRLQGKAYRSAQFFDTTMKDQIDVQAAGAQNNLQQISKEIQALLEQEATWGAAGKAQKRLNKPFSIMLSNESKFRKKFSFEPGAREPTPITPEPKGAPARSGGVLDSQRVTLSAKKSSAKKLVRENIENNMDEVGIESMQIFKDQRANMREWLGAIEEVFGPLALTDEFKAIKRGWLAKTDATDKALTRVTQLSSARKVLGELVDTLETSGPLEIMRSIKELMPGKAGAALGATIGGATLGPVGAAVGGAVGGIGGRLYGSMADSMKSPAERFLRLSNLQARAIQARKKASKHVDRAVDKLTKNKDGTFRGAVKIKSSTWANKWGRVLARDNGEWQSTDDREISEEAILSLLGWRADPGTLQQKIAVSTAMLAGIAPKVSEAMQTKLGEVCMYAANNVDPSIIVTQDPFTGKQEVSGPDYAFGKFNDMMMPLDMGLPYITDNLINGTLTPTMIYAWKINFPAQYSGFCSELMTKLAPMGKQVSYAARGSITALFGVPLESSYSPGTMSMLQNTWETRDAETDQRGSGGTNRPSALKNQVRAMETQTNRHQAPSLE